MINSSIQKCKHQVDCARLVVGGMRVWSEPKSKHLTIKPMEQLLALGVNI